MDTGERDALLMLTLTPGLGPTLSRRLIERFGGAQAALGQPAAMLRDVQGIGPDGAERIAREIEKITSSEVLAQELERVEALDARIIVEDEAEYPRLLKHIPDPPPLIYVRGQMEEDDAVALAVVGARKCTLYGREQADRISALCAQAGLTIISGGADGIDGAAHQAALRVKGRTIAVIGSGLARPYPTHHAPLFDEIVTGGHGAIISELPMNAPPRAQNFPRRNRIISGLSLGVLVVEAANRSGALITARLATEEHGREVMALPGPVTSATSAGCHKAIREGWAALVTSAADVLDALGETGSLLKVGMTVETTTRGNIGNEKGNGEDGDSGDGRASTTLAVRNLTPTQRKIIEAFESDALAMDEIAARTGLAVSTIQADLTMLEIRGAVTRAAGRFSRK